MSSYDSYVYIKFSQITAAFDVDGEGFVVVGSEHSECCTQKREKKNERKKAIYDFRFHQFGNMKLLMPEVSSWPHKHFHMRCCK